jgi:DnaJ domain
MVAKRSSRLSAPSDSMNMSIGPSDALIQLIAPDGYYTYLGIPKPSAADIAAAAESVSSSFIPKTATSTNNNTVTGSAVNEDLVKKAYRKLSLKHHPDKSGGDADTFRVLNRAQKVLLNPKLRQQYDILGLDLDDDDEDRNNLHSADDGKEDDTATQGIVHEIATMTMAGIMHIALRTGMLFHTQQFVGLPKRMPNGLTVSFFLSLFFL